MLLSQAILDRPTLSKPLPRPMDIRADFKPQPKDTSSKLLRFLKNLREEDYKQMQGYLEKEDPPPKGIRINIYQDIQMICAFKRQEYQLQHCGNQQQRGKLQQSIIQELAETQSLKPVTIKERISKKIPGVPIINIMTSMRQNKSLMFSGKNLAAGSASESSDREIEDKADDEAVKIEENKITIAKQTNQQPLIAQKVENKSWESLYKYGVEKVKQPIMLQYDSDYKKVYCFKEQPPSESSSQGFSVIQGQFNPTKQLKALQKWSEVIKKNKQPIYLKQEYKSQIFKLLNTTRQSQSKCTSTQERIKSKIWRELAKTIRAIKGVLVHLIRLSSDKPTSSETASNNACRDFETDSDT